MKDLVLKRLKDNRFALVTESPIYTLDGTELERGLIIDNYQSKYAEFIEGGDQLYYELGEETLYKVYRTVGYTLEGIGVEIEENTFYKTEDSDSKIIFSNDELLKILKEGNNYIIAQDDYDDYYVIKGNTKIPCDEDILDVPKDEQYELPNGKFIAFLSEEDEVIGPCNKLEIMDRLYHTYI